MTTQLRLLEGGKPQPWDLDARTRRIGRHGVAKARAALEKAKCQSPHPTGERRAS